VFTNRCSSCDRTQLIFPSQVTGLVEGGSELVLAYTCWCGAAQTWTVSEADHGTGIPA